MRPDGRVAAAIVSLRCERLHSASRRALLARFVRLFS